MAKRQTMSLADHRPAPQAEVAHVEPIGQPLSLLEELRVLVENLNTPTIPRGWPKARQEMLAFYQSNPDRRQDLLKRFFDETAGEEKRKREAEAEAAARDAPLEDETCWAVLREFQRSRRVEEAVSQ